MTFQQKAWKTKKDFDIWVAYKLGRYYSGSGHYVLDYLFTCEIIMRPL